MSARASSVVGEAGSGEDTVRVVRSVRPDSAAARSVDAAHVGPGSAARAGRRAATACGRSCWRERSTGRTCSRPSAGCPRPAVEGRRRPRSCSKPSCACMAGRYWLGQTLVSDLLETVRPLIQSSGAPGGRLAYGLTPRERQVLTMVASRALQQGDRPAMRHQRRNRQAPSHPHVRQARRLQPARACDDRDRARAGPGF